MGFKQSITHYSVNHPKAVTGGMVVLALAFVLLAFLPSMWPETFSALHGITVDTDPENMLPHDEPVRLFHDSMKKEMALYDIVVLGMVNETDPDGVFNPGSLKKIYELTEYAKTLTWPDENDPEKRIGVVEVDLIAPSLVDNIEPGGLGEVRFEWLMEKPPDTREAAVEIRRKAERIPFLNGTLISEDGRALCLYLPITSKDLAYRIYTKLQEKIDTFEGDDRFFITGLPVAEDTFGVEMFVQMAVSAPIAMAVIFLLMLFFFRRLVLVISPMIVAMVSVFVTMGFLIATGNTVHIMSSMIPIFIMPIAVLDGVHILSEFFDRYQETRDRKKTITGVMDTLFQPMLYTSITTAVGFASLALTPIPPVQIFGLFIAFGVLNAWIWTIIFIPAFIMMMPERTLENFGHAPGHEEDAGSMMAGMLRALGRFTFKHARLVMVAAVLVVVVSVFGISKIRINDNPTLWFNASHPIRVADRVLNAHFGGTYMAYLALLREDRTEDRDAVVQEISARMQERARELAPDVERVEEIFKALLDETARIAPDAADRDQLLARLEEYATAQSEEADDDLYFAWEEVLLFIDEERGRSEVFKQPAVLDYMVRLQEHLAENDAVGKSNGLADIVRTVHRELFEGDPEKFTIPDSARAVAQCLITFQNSHRPHDLWHFVTPDYRKSVFWIQLKSGNNIDMQSVVADVAHFFETDPPPIRLTHQWFGLTYINVVWQDKMVSGMLEAFMGSFLIVFLMMTLVYRSALWGFLSMIPLTVTIGLIYGMIGLIGKDYDMPVAVLSSLSLGLAVDYAIHFLSRSRTIREEKGDWAKASEPVFGEPARAITRNIVVVGMGFLPLLAAPLVPYKTVGTFIAAILFTAGVASLFILPALITLLERWLFPATATRDFTCKCGTCIISGIGIVMLVAINIHQFFSVGWNTLSWPAVGAILILAALCLVMGRARRCRTDKDVIEGEKS